MTDSVPALATRTVAAPVEAVSRRPERSERLEVQAQQLESYVQAGGGEPAPQPSALAVLAAGPIPPEQLQRVQTLLAQTRALAAHALRAFRPTEQERQATFRATLQDA